MAAAGISLAALGYAAAASGSFEGNSGSMVYVSDRHGLPEIYMARWDVTFHTTGGDIRQANSTPCTDETSTEPPRTETFIETRLTNSSGANLHPTWSSQEVSGDGTRTWWEVAFDSDRVDAGNPEGDREIYTHTITSPGGLGWELEPVLEPGPPRQLTSNDDADHSPAWSRDEQLAFISDRSGNAEIYVMDADGSNERRVTFHDADDREPAWSPNGTQIAFVSDRGGSPEIWRVPAGGGAATQLTHGPAPKRNPDWFHFRNFGAPKPPPEDELILFDSPRIEFGAGEPDAVDSELYYVNAIGSNQRRIGSAPADETHPVWSPSASCVAFDSDRTGRRQIHVADTAGRHLRQVTRLGSNWDPSWQGTGPTDASTPNPTDRPPVSGLTCTKTIAAGRSRLVGTPGNDVLCGKGGGERIYGRGGNDVISGGGGRDYLSGGAAADRMYGSDGQRDKIAGGRGRDVATVDRRRDLVRSIEIRR